MRQLQEAKVEIPGPVHSPEHVLDLVVPFTTPDLTRAAMNAANRMGAGLNAAIRLVKVQVVPFPMDPDQSPVNIKFLEKQMQAFRTELPVSTQIVLARELEPALLGTLTRDSIVFLATKNRPWRTNTERLAASLRQASYKVVLVSQEGQNA